MNDPDPRVRVVWRDSDHGWLCVSPDGVPLSEFKPPPGHARAGRLIYRVDTYKIVEVLPET